MIQSLQHLETIKGFKHRYQFFFTDGSEHELEFIQAEGRTIVIDLTRTFPKDQFDDFLTELTKRHDFPLTLNMVFREILTAP